MSVEVRGPCEFCCKADCYQFFCADGGPGFWCGDQSKCGMLRGYWMAGPGRDADDEFNRKLATGKYRLDLVAV